MQKTLILSAIIATMAGTADAQEQGRVLSATPIVQQIGRPRQVCGTETVYSGNRTSGAGAVLGAIAGGAAGNAVGKGTGRAAATAIGLLGGAMLGDHIEGNGQPQYQNVQRCTTETYYENRTVGYDVVYEYAGRQYSTRTQSDPGSWIALTVQPTGQTYSTQPQVIYSQPGVVTSTYLAAPVYQSPDYPPPPGPMVDFVYESGRYGHQHRNSSWR